MGNDNYEETSGPKFRSLDDVLCMPKGEQNPNREGKNIGKIKEHGNHAKRKLGIDIMSKLGVKNKCKVTVDPLEGLPL